MALTLETGKFGVASMALLDRANTSAYGNPEITRVKIGVGKNPGILVSGHDLRDLEMLLEQTQGTGVDVYTHSEMLPAHSYPAFKKYPNFVGNYGSAWWKQREEFEAFRGPILMTTNCIVPPKDSYKDRLYTTGTTGYPGCKYIPGEIGQRKDFSVIIEHAKRCPPPEEIESGEIICGFAHAQVFALADKIVDAVKSGAIKKFVVMGGCDGRAKSREYYTEFAKALPKDVVILTAGCAKYRYNKLSLGEINGIPRVLDAGQCNDSYSLAVIALKLKEIFGLEDVNDLPIVYNIAWYEQKAVIVLLALLSLGIKNIHLGPTLPAFLSPNVTKVLVEKFKIAGIGTVEEDMDLFFKERPNKKRSPDFALKKERRFTLLHSKAPFLFSFALPFALPRSFLLCGSVFFQLPLRSFHRPKNQTRSRSQAVPAQRAAARPPAASSSNRGSSRRARGSPLPTRGCNRRGPVPARETGTRGIPHPAPGSHRAFRRAPA